MFYHLRTEYCDHKENSDIIRFHSQKYASLSCLLYWWWCSLWDVDLGLSDIHFQPGRLLRAKKCRTRSSGVLKVCSPEGPLEYSQYTLKYLYFTHLSTEIAFSVPVGMHFPSISTEMLRYWNKHHYSYNLFWDNKAGQIRFPHSLDEKCTFLAAFDLLFCE